MKTAAIILENYSAFSSTVDDRPGHFIPRFMSTECTYLCPKKYIQECSIGIIGIIGLIGVGISHSLQYKSEMKVN